MPAAECPLREENTETSIISSILLNLVTSDLINNFNRIVAPYIHTHRVTFQELLYFSSAIYTGFIDLNQSRPLIELVSYYQFKKAVLHVEMCFEEIKEPVIWTIL